MRACAQHTAMFHSDSDPYITQAELAALRGHLQADLHAIEGARHFAAQDSFPELRALIMRLYGPEQC